MSHPFRHFVTITKHRHQVIRNAFHMGIFFHALKHDLSKLTPIEFNTSAKYYAGNYSPVYKERMSNHYFSRICQHHTRRNPHHWEYWTDFFNGRIVIKTMPYVWATEYVCDMLSAAKTYDPKHFKPEVTLAYFRSKSPHYYMTKATRSYIDWCLETYAEVGWKGLKKRITKAKYKEITAKYPEIEVCEQLRLDGELPPLEH
ncbi:MAG: DUF5662 family protein [Bacilli bacterium]